MGVHRQRGAHVSLCSRSAEPRLSGATVLDPLPVWNCSAECPPWAGDRPGLSPHWGPVPATCPGARAGQRA